MAIALELVGTCSKANATSVTPAIPVGTSAGQLMIVTAALKANNVLTVTAGWEIFDHREGATLSYLQAWRFFQAGDGDPTVSGTDAGRIIGVIHVWSGVDTVTPIVNAANSTFAAPSGPPYDVTVSGWSETNDNVGVTTVVSVDDNTWAKQTAGYTVIIEGANTDNTSISMALAYQTVSGGAAADCVFRQTANGPDAGGKNSYAIKAAVSGPATLAIGETETGAIVEDKTVSVSAQPTLAPSKSEAGALTESVAVAVILCIAVTDAGVLVEGRTVQVSAQPNLAPSVLDIGLITEDKSAQVSAQPTLQPSIIDVGLITEDRVVQISTQPTLQSNVFDAGLITEEKTIQVITEGTEDLLAQSVEQGVITEAVSVFVSAQAVLEAQAIEQARLSEDVTAFTAQLVLELAAQDSANLTEVVVGQISAQVTLLPDIIESGRLTEETTLTLSALGVPPVPWLRRRRRM